MTTHYEILAGSTWTLTRVPDAKLGEGHFTDGGMLVYDVDTSTAGDTHAVALPLHQTFTDDDAALRNVGEVDFYLDGFSVYWYDNEAEPSRTVHVYSATKTMHLTGAGIAT